MKSKLYLAALLAIPVSANAVVVDGDITLAEGYTNASYQNNATNFGDNFNELDGIYARFDGTNLNVGITGNLASGNAIMVFLDAGTPAGQNVLNATGIGAPSYVAGQSGMKFDVGFTPDVVIAMNRFNNDVYYDLVDLVSGTTIYAGTHAISGGGPVIFGPAYFDNSNTAGVGGGTGIDSGASATKGWEFLGNASGATNIKMMAMLTNNGDGFASNQVLGGLGGGYDNLGFGGGSSGASRIDFSQIAGDQCMTVTAVPEPATMSVLALGALAAIRKRRNK